MVFFALMSGSCRPPQPAAQAPDAGEESAPALPSPEAFARTAEVQLLARQPPPDLGRGAELMGLVTALMELGLADLDGVVTHTSVEAPDTSEKVDASRFVDASEKVDQSIADPPGLHGALVGGAEQWRLSLSVSDLPWTAPARGEPVPPHWVEIRVTLAQRGAADTSAHLLRSFQGSREDPTPAIDELLDQIAGVLLQPRRPEVLDDARAAPSADPYAILLAGRAAASWYGFLPSTPDEKRGDKRRDPVARALLVDPDTAVGNWIAGRRELADGELAQAARHLELASFARPSSLLLAADAAAALDAAGRREAAWFAWSALDARRPGDPRFVVSASAAALAAGQAQEAQARLDALTGAQQRTAEVAALRVAVAEAGSDRDYPSYDRLLAIWADAAPTDPEPVRRRVAVAAHAGAYLVAFPLANELARRGAPDEADVLRLACQTALGQLEAARQTARALDLTEAEAGLAARAASDWTGVLAALSPASADPYSQALMARASLCSGDPSAALRYANTALGQSAALPEALDVAAQATTALGDARAASVWSARLKRADPAYTPADCALVSAAAAPASGPAPRG